MLFILIISSLVDLVVMQPSSFLHDRAVPELLLSEWMTASRAPARIWQRMRIVISQPLEMVVLDMKEKQAYARTIGEMVAVN